MITYNATKTIYTIVPFFIIIKYWIVLLQKKLKIYNQNVCTNTMKFVSTYLKGMSGFKVLT